MYSRNKSELGVTSPANIRERHSLIEKQLGLWGQSVQNHGYHYPFRQMTLDTVRVAIKPWFCISIALEKHFVFAIIRYETSCWNFKRRQRNLHAAESLFYRFGKKESAFPVRRVEMQVRWMQNAESSDVNQLRMLNKQYSSLVSGSLSRELKSGPTEH